MTDDQTQSFDDAESAARSESVSESLPGSAQPDTSHDLPGEQLAAARREPVDDYVVADPEAEELTTPDSADAASHIDDPAQLADADQVARTARSSRPVRRSAPLPVAEDEPVDRPTGGPTDDVAGEQAIPGTRLRPRRRPADASGAGSTGATALAVAESGSERSVARKRTARKRDVTTIDPDHRVGPVEFTRQSVDELRKVIWPTGEQLMQYFGVVLAFVLFIITFVGLLDLFFGWSLLKLLGN